MTKQPSKNVDTSILHSQTLKEKSTTETETGLVYYGRNVLVIFKKKEERK